MSDPRSPADGEPHKLPGTFRAFSERFPELAAAHEYITQTAQAAGPLDDRTCALIRIGLALGAGMESAVRSHVRRALQAGASPQEIEQAIALATTTLGFPRTIAGWSWAREQFARHDRDAHAPAEIAP